MDGGRLEPRGFLESRTVFSSIQARYFQLIFPPLVLVILKHQ